MADDDDGDNDDVEPSSISFHAAFARRRLHWLKDGVWACEGRQGWDAATAEPAEASDSLFWGDAAPSWYVARNEGTVLVVGNALG